VIALVKTADGFRLSGVSVKNGNAITGIAEQTQRWKSHFETIVNNEAPNNQVGIPVGDQRRRTNCRGSEENSQDNDSWKAPGADGVSADM